MTAAGASPEPIRVALVDSGLGLLGYADALNRLRPDLDLVLALDVDHMPYGPRHPDEVAALVTQSVEATLPFHPSAVIVACNTASVHGLDQLRDRFEPGIPVVGTVPAIRPAATTGGPVAIWATVATTGSDYQRRLIDEFAAGVEVTPIACPGLAEAVESGDLAAVDAAIRSAAARTPASVRALVLGCTHYGLIADRIQAALGPDVRLFDSPEPVARQALRRLGIAARPDAEPGAIVGVLLSGRPGRLPETVRQYAVGRRLAALERAPVNPAT